MRRDPEITCSRPGWAKRRRAVGSALVAVGLAAGALAELPGPAAYAEPYCPPEERPCLPDPEPPPGTTPPEPGTVEITSRTTEGTAASLGLKFRIGKGAKTWALERQLASGWVTIRSGTSFGNAFYRTTTHSGLTPDTRYCYRVRASNDVGTSYSTSIRCAYTRDGRNADAWRVEARVSTANVSDGGTSDDNVAVSLSGPYSHVMPKWTWLDRGKNDFERGDTEDYDLSKVGELGDITGFTLENHSDDDWCVQSVSIVVNGKTAFRYDWGIQTCKWIGADSASTRVVFPHANLRASSYWRNYVYTPPYTFEPLPGGSGTNVTRRYSRTQIQEMVESAVGDAMHDNPLYWGQLYNEPVEAKRLSERVLGVDVDAAASITGPDPEVDIDFELHVSASLNDDSQPEVNVSLENASVDAEYDWWGEVLSLGLVELIEREIEDQVAEEIPRFEESVDSDVPVSSITASVSSSGDLVFVAILG